jgi:hypothetical protein
VFFVFEEEICINDDEENLLIYIPLTKPMTALPALRPSISPISIGTELPEKRIH